MGNTEDSQQLPAGAEADNADRLPLASTTKHQGFASADTRFRSYVTFYSNLDNLIWRNITTLLTVTGIGGAIVGTLINRPESRLFNLSHEKTVAATFFLISILYFVSVFTLRRMRHHHVLIEKHLRALEPEAYFHARKAVVSQWWWSATFWNSAVFSLLGICSLVASVCYFLGSKEVMPKSWISSEQASSQFGIVANHERMANGELRFRLMGQDGNGYIRTIAGDAGYWQKSHFHLKCRETYIVERGWMALAVPEASVGQARIQVFEVGQTFTTMIGEVHNVYLSAGAIIHTIKHGAATAAVADWHAAPDFDNIVTRITESDLGTFRKNKNIP